MAILTPEHLFDQADRLMAPVIGRPREVDLRRAASAAYYGVFHFVNREVANEVAGPTQQRTPRYALAYRSLDHRVLRETCDAIRRSTPPARYEPFIPQGGFHAGLVTFAAAVPNLQDRRHAADYDPLAPFSTLDVRASLATARAAVAQYLAADIEHKRMFLTLLLCPPRSLR